MEDEEAERGPKRPRLLNEVQNIILQKLKSEKWQWLNGREGRIRGWDEKKVKYLVSFGKGALEIKVKEKYVARKRAEMAYLLSAWEEVRAEDQMTAEIYTKNKFVANPTVIEVPLDERRAIK